MGKTELELYSYIEYGKGVSHYEIVNYDGDIIERGTSTIKKRVYLENNKLYQIKGKVYVVDKELICANGDGYRLKLHDDTVYNLITGEEVK